jgi:antitoxin component YwqK of YwqJK toxin-antitoxin module
MSILLLKKNNSDSVSKVTPNKPESNVSNESSESSEEAILEEYNLNENGEKEGLYRKYVNGILRMECVYYENGVIDFYRSYYSDGKKYIDVVMDSIDTPSSIIVYHENGNIILELYVHEWVSRGIDKFMVYDKNGKVIESVLDDVHLENDEMDFIEDYLPMELSFLNW